MERIPDTHINAYEGKGFDVMLAFLAGKAMVSDLFTNSRLIICC
jgi:hypothetical protein